MATLQGSLLKCLGPNLKTKKKKKKRTQLTCFSYFPQEVIIGVSHAVTYKSFSRI